MTPILQIADIVIEARRPRDRQANTIVKFVSLTVMPGETVALIGESGAGKTTVALSALGYARPGTRVVAGRVTLDGADVLALDGPGRAALRGSKAAYIAQSAQAALNPVMTLGMQVAEPAIIHGLANRRAALSKATGLLEALHLPDPEALALRYPFQASGGQLQRVMIAMAMSCGPRLLVLDEPTTALDVITQIEVLRLVKEIVRRERVAALYVSHDLAVVAQVADRIIVMKDGEIVETGTTAELLAAARHPYTRSLLAAVRTIPASPGVGVGEAAAAGAPPLLELRSIDASYDPPRLFTKPDPERQVLKGAGLTLDHSEVLAVVGESGSGKTTLARVVAGLHRPASGTIRFNGATLPPTARGRPRDLRRRIQIIFQSPDLSLNPERKVGAILGRARQLYFRSTGRERDKAVAKLLESVGLPSSYADRYPGTISGGERQRVSIARALAAEPQLLICDEILSSLDTVVATAMLELMRDLRRRFDLAYLFISHDLSTVAEIADRVMVLYAGQVVETGRISDVFSPGHHPYTDVLLSSVPQLRTGWLDDCLTMRRLAPSEVQADWTPHKPLCPFLGRCPVAISGTCDRLAPPRQSLDGGHDVLCHRRIGEMASDQSDRARRLRA